MKIFQYSKKTRQAIALLPIALSVLSCFFMIGQKECNAQLVPPTAPQNIRLYPTGGGGFLQNVQSTFIQYEFVPGGGARPRSRPVSFDIVFDSVQGATSYLVDVAEDSLFARLLPGLQNYFVRPPYNDCYRPQFVPDVRYGTISCNPPLGKIAIRIVYLLQGKRYFVRVKSVNSVGESAYSTTTSVEVRWSTSYQTGYSIIQNRYISAQIRQLTDTSITFALSRNSAKIQAVLNYKDTIPPTQGDEITIQGLRQGTTNTVNLGAIPMNFCCVEDSLPFRIRPFSREMARYGRVISYYEGPEMPVGGFGDLYYAYPLLPGVSLGQIEDSLRSLQAQQIAVDTAWFHTGGFVTCVGEDINVCRQLDISYPGLIVKLRRNDTRMTSLGYRSVFTPFIGAWRFSDEAVYYRFDIGSTVPVREVPDAKGYSLSIVPNPMQGTSEIRYTLPEASSITTEVYDVLGRKIFTLPEQWQTAGEHSVSFETSGLSAGLYLVRCTVRNAGGIKHLSQYCSLVK